MSLVYFLLCLPIFTIGAATTALYYTAMKFISGDDGYVIKKIKKSFLENFVSSTKLWILFIFTGTVVLANVIFWFEQKKAGAIIFNEQVINFLIILFVVLLILIIMTMVFAFPMEAKFKNRLYPQIRNSFLMSIKYFPTTIIVIVCNILMAYLFYINVAYIILVFFIGAGIIFTFYSFLFSRVFKPYIILENQSDDNITENIKEENKEENKEI